MKYVIAIIMLMILVVGCAPAATTPLPSATPPVTKPPAATTTPAATPPPAPVTPPVPAPAAKTLSFIPATYTNDALGFTLQHPKEWEKAELWGDMVIKVQPVLGQGSDTVLVIIVPETADFSSAAKDGFKTFFGSGALIGKVDATPAKSVTLADGKTPATETTLTTKIRDIVDVNCYAIGFNKGGKTVIAFAATVKGDSSKALVKEIAQTLAVK